MFPRKTHLTVCPSSSHVNHGSHSFVSFLCLSISARCCIGNINARNVEHEGDRRCSYVVHINNYTITKEGQNPICEVLARSCWRAGPSQEASDGSKVRKVGKLGPFIPCEVRAQTEPTQATMLAVGRRRHWPTTSVSARATASPLGREHLRLGDNFYARVTTSTPRRQLLRQGSNVCAQATASTPGRQCLCLGDDVCCVRS